MSEEELIQFLIEKGGSPEAISRMTGELSALAVQEQYRNLHRMVISLEQAESISREYRLKVVTVATLDAGEATSWKGIESLLGL